MGERGWDEWEIGTMDTRRTGGRGGGGVDGTKKIGGNLLAHYRWHDVM